MRRRRRKLTTVEEEEDEGLGRVPDLSPGKKESVVEP